MQPIVAVVDNYDSFTYNLVQYAASLGARCEVWLNDRVTTAQLAELHPQGLLLSPGPGTPDDAGVTLEAIRAFGGHLPILGVCLGHQAIGQAFGGKVIRAARLMHGKTSPILHDGQGIFRNVPSPFEATRYHSLLVEDTSLPDCLTVTARTEEGEIMALRHKTMPIEGVQFHPESILTEHGLTLISNWLAALDRA